MLLRAAPAAAQLEHRAETVLPRELLADVRHRAHVLALDEHPLIRRQASSRAATRRPATTRRRRTCPGRQTAAARVPDGRCRRFAPRFGRRRARRRRARASRAGTSPAGARAPSIEIVRWTCPRWSIDDDLLRRDDGEIAAVRRPLEVGGDHLDRRAPDEPSVCTAQHDRAAAVVRDGVKPRRVPRRRHVARVRVEQMVIGPVAGDDAQTAMRRCTRSACRSSSLPSAATHGSCRASFHRTLAVRIEGDELVPLGRDHVEPVRRPLGVGIRAELAQEAVGPTSQTPPSSADTTSSRPGAGSEKSAGSACSIPTASRTDLKTARPGGETAATTTAATAAAVAASTSL